jgi:hypothetical protein
MGWGQEGNVLRGTGTALDRLPGWLLSARIGLSVEDAWQSHDVPAAPRLPPRE